MTEKRMMNKCLRTLDEKKAFLIMHKSELWLIHAHSQHQLSD